MRENVYFWEIERFIQSDADICCAQAGATAVVPETLEPSLQLASAVLSQLNMPPDDVQEAIQEFRRAHMGELQALPSSVYILLALRLWLPCPLRLQALYGCRLSPHA